MSLLTGAARAASVVAETDVECWRLDREAFQRLLEHRPELAEEVAETLAKRHIELEDIKEHMSQEAKAKRLAAHQRDFADRIKSFFGVDRASIS